MRFAAFIALVLIAVLTAWHFEPPPPPPSPVIAAPRPQPRTALEVVSNRTAVYVIAEHVVYMPDGRVLEAHSGLSRWMDNPAGVRLGFRGPTPPNVYDLSLRPGLFFGVHAITLTPRDEAAMHGRFGILAHSYLLRGGGQGSEGCVSFADYSAFLRAFMRGEVNTMRVVEHL